MSHDPRTTTARRAAPDGIRDEVTVHGFRRPLASVAILALALLCAPAGAGESMGTLRGRVVFKGTPPEPPRVKSTDPACGRGELAVQREVEVGPGGGLSEALVRLPVGTRGGRAQAPPPALVDQRGCRYAPRVVGVVAGQDLVIRNSDGTLHNVHTYRGDATVFNVAQPAGSRDLERNLDDDGLEAGDVLRFTCDVHPWMRAWAVVTDHPYFRVTGADGAFELEVPAGTHTVEAWHPELGSRTAKVTVRPGRVAEVEIVFSANDRPRR